MSQSEFNAALLRVNFSAGLLAAHGSQYSALCDLMALADRLEQHVAVATPLPFSPMQSPLTDAGVFFPACPPAPLPLPPTGIFFAPPHSFANPPPPPNLHDTKRRDRPQLHTMPKGAPDVPASMYPSKRAAAAARASARRASTPDAG